jgi:hypothetical protein
LSIWDSSFPRIPWRLLPSPAVGHRLKLVRTDASAQPPSPMVAAAPQLAATTAQAPIAEAAGERRHITVMFCDLIGSSSISAGLDAEDWRNLVESVTTSLLRTRRQLRPQRKYRPSTLRELTRTGSQRTDSLRRVTTVLVGVFISPRCSWRWAAVHPATAVLHCRRLAWCPAPSSGLATPCPLQTAVCCLGDSSPVPRPRRKLS